MKLFSLLQGCGGEGSKILNGIGRVTKPELTSVRINVISPLGIFLIEDNNVIENVILNCDWLIRLNSCREPAEIDFKQSMLPMFENRKATNFIQNL